MDCWPFMDTKHLTEFGSVPWGVGMLVKMIPRFCVRQTHGVVGWTVVEFAVPNLLGRRIPFTGPLSFKMERMQALFGGTEKSKEFGWLSSWPMTRNRTSLSSLSPTSILAESIQYRTCRL